MDLGTDRLVMTGACMRRARGDSCHWPCFQPDWLMAQATKYLSISVQPVSLIWIQTCWPMAKAAKYLSFSAQPVSLPSDLDSFRLAMLKKRSLQASNLTDGTRYQVPLLNLTFSEPEQRQRWRQGLHWCGGTGYLYINVTILWDIVNIPPSNLTNDIVTIPDKCCISGVCVAITKIYASKQSWWLPSGSPSSSLHL